MTSAYLLTLFFKLFEHMIQFFLFFLLYFLSTLFSYSVSSSAKADSHLLAPFMLPYIHLPLDCFLICVSDLWLLVPYISSIITIAVA